jgi:hypothetical protein
LQQFLFAKRLNNGGQQHHYHYQPRRSMHLHFTHARTKHPNGGNANFTRRNRAFPPPNFGVVCSNSKK